MSKLSLMLGVSFSFSALASVSQVSSPTVIYGDDNRHDVYSYADRKIVDLSKSTVALVSKSKISRSALGISTLPSRSYGVAGDLCKSERFYDQPEAAHCSGFLIAPNKIVTAGHCIEDASECADTKFIFGYAMKDEKTPTLSFKDSEIVGCKKILGREKLAKGIDFAVIELDRNVTDRAPLKLATNATLKTEDRMFVIGHPSGLPTKITDDAKVRSINLAGGFFVANLDTYGGNSGSAVFNEKTLEVEGILVRGENDFIGNDAGKCIISNQIASNEGRGEDVSLISRIHERGNILSDDQLLGGAPRFVWLTSDNTCNEFHGEDYIREVSNSLCSDAPSSHTTSTSGTVYHYLSSDNSCNEFTNDRYIREVDIALCPDAPAIELIWLTSDSSCNEFRGNSFIREVEDALCGH